jgi:hypothetical protein
MLLNPARDKGYKYFVGMKLAYRKKTPAKTRNSYVGMLRYDASVIYCVCFGSHDKWKILMGINVGKNGSALRRF